MPYFKRFILLSLCFFMSWAVFATIYTWTDESGIVNYSDQPHSDASVVNLSVDSIPQKQQDVSEKTPLTPPLVNSESAVSEEKISLEIVAPKNEETIRSAQGEIIIHVTVKPFFKKESQIQIALDGLVVGKPQHSNSFRLSGVERGSHTLTAQLVDEHGTLEMESPKITIFMMPPRVNMVPHQRVL